MKRVLVGYGIDVDVAATWLNTGDGSAVNPTDISRGVYGAVVGIGRLLKLLDKYGIRATWFVPGHTIESFPEHLRPILDGGHEFGLHGYTHERTADMSEQQQRDILKKSIEVMTEFTGKKPKGWTGPSWSTSRRTPHLLEEYGVEYDHSFMHHDCQMYYLPYQDFDYVETDLTKPASYWMKPLGPTKESSLVVVPANWHVDDSPPLNFKPKQLTTHGFVSPHVVESLWMEQFDYFYREYDTFVFPISIHPQISGKPQNVLMHERIIEYINEHEGVEWMTMEEMVAEFKSGRMAGVDVCHPS